MEGKTIGVSAVIALGMILAISVVPGWFDSPKYYCEERPELGLMGCDGFSKYVSLEGKCLNASQEGVSYGNKICKSGWKLVVDDRVETAEELVSEEPEVVIKTVFVGPPAKGDYSCSPPPKGCVAK